MVFNPDNLKIGRKKRGITKTKLASLVGVDLRSVSAWEAGTSKPSDENLKNLSHSLELPTAFFSTDTEEMPEPE